MANSSIQNITVKFWMATLQDCQVQVVILPALSLRVKKLCVYRWYRKDLYDIMLKIKALNQESSSDEDVPTIRREAQASELDSTDVTLWSKIGKLALKEDKFNKAAYAFSKGLECNESHWPCLDNLISVLYAIKDTVSCLVYIGKALMLDADYTKGIVLRKQIYKDNPATKEYYKLFNPDYIYEPNVDKADEEDILKEAECLCNRVTALESSLGPKPLDTIPLPKSPEEYTWLDLAKTVIYCHQYITEHNMSHFTYFDMSKCMSQSGESTEVLPIHRTTEDVAIIKDNSGGEAKPVEILAETSSAVEKMQTEPIVIERRFSQASENTDGNENLDNTNTQTDNDEEQIMELDNDNDMDGDNADIAQQRRKGKRKRDLLSDLQIWGWHSKRKQPKKSNRDFTIEDALNRIIPKSLLKTKINSKMLSPDEEDSMNTMDIYNLYMDTKDLHLISPIHSPMSITVEPYFGTDHETEDVKHFWVKERSIVDAIVLVKELVFELSKFWGLKWPKELIPLYIEAFKMFREHYDQPQPFCGDHSFEQIREDALATLLYGELHTFSSGSTESLHPTYLSYLQIVSSWNDDWKDEFSMVFMRFYWLQAHCFQKADDNELAIHALEAILEEINAKGKEIADNFTLSLPNCMKYGFISKGIIETMIKHMNMIISLGNIENLFNSQKYSEVADILKETFFSGSYSKVGRMGRPAQLGILMHSLWFTDWEDCFIWTEECLNEAIRNYVSRNTDYDKWEKIVGKCLGIFQEIINKESVSIIDKLTEEKRRRLVENLVKIVCKQLNADVALTIPLGSITAWVLLHYILLREEQRQYANKRLNQAKRDKMDTSKECMPEPVEEELPPSIAILFSAHEFLGPKGWCLTGNGELLHFILDTILDRLDTPIFEPFRDKIDIHIEQALFCLYLYPSKKNKISRHLVDHNVNPIPLTWQRSFQLYQYYAPDSLPEFNSYKSQSISADLEQLFKRIIGLIPNICALYDHLPLILDFINGKTNQVPHCIEFPGRVKAIYYLLGDYYFKERDFARCIKYFQLDICINPLRVDSWAGLALSYAAQLENSLNYCEKLKNESDFFDKAKSAQMCFRRALELDPENLVLWIECGSFEYLVHSFCSRLLKYESENFSMEKFELLESEKESYLDSSGNSLEHAIKLYEIDSSNEPDERWLQYYILGKIAEKKRKEPSEYLQYYVTASNLLNENKALYPEKISYNNPQHLSVEALELHYRIHASILKYLELHEGKAITNAMGIFFKKCLSTTAKRYTIEVPPSLPTPQLVDDAMTITTQAASTNFQDQFLTSTEVEDEGEAQKIVKSCLEDLLGKVENIINNKNSVEVPKANILETRAEDTAVKSDNSQDMDVTIVENEEVIMIISDSEEENIDAPDISLKNNKKETVEKVSFSQDEKMIVDANEGINDVQLVLDQMMEQTMKNTEYSDHNNSGQIESDQVVSKDDSNSKDQAAQSKETDDPKAKSLSNETQNLPEDSERAKENKKPSGDEESSSSSSSSSSDSSSSDSDSDDSDSSSTSSTSDSTNENISHGETLQIVDKCVQGLEICVSRLPQNYKALYRLSHLFFNYKGRKDYAKCKQLLLGEYKCKDNVAIKGLFSERTSKHFFNGIWRIPSTEIDRPGSLAAHMNRCISLVLQVLRNTNDTKTLVELCMQLKKAPDRDKIYIKDSDRVSYCDQAMEMCVQSFRGQITNIPNLQSQQVTKLLHDIFRIYQRTQKYIPNKESTFSALLINAYKTYMKEVPENVNVLDLAVKFCQQHKPLEKQKSGTSTPSISYAGRSPGLANSPVLPTPNILLPSQKSLKPPGVNRPRGRPPLPKMPGQIRQSRTKSPSTRTSGVGAYPWQNPMYGANFNYEYLKHYQDELIKQYSQNLSLTQLKHLTSFFTSGQLNNPTVAQAVASQFLSQANLYNSSNPGLLRPPTSGGAAASSTPLLNPTNLLRGFNTPLSTTVGSTPQEQMKILESLLPNMTKQACVKTSRMKSTHSTTSTAVSSFKQGHSGKAHTTLATSKLQPDYSKLKATARPNLKPKLGPKFAHPNLMNHIESKAANLLMKDRPSISITPVGNLPSTHVIGQSTSKQAQTKNASSPLPHAQFSSYSIPKQKSMSASSLSATKPIHTSNASSSDSTLSHMKPKSAYTSTITSSATFTKPAPVATPQFSNSVSVVQAPAAHSSTSPKSAHVMPATPPPVSSPSFFKPASTSGKTLQEKLADKKKEQDSKQMLKNMEAEKMVSKLPSSSASGLLKSLNIPNIPSSLTVSPSMAMPGKAPYLMEAEKQANFGKYPNRHLEQNAPSTLTVSQAQPPPVYSPRFSSESGISISQVVSPKTCSNSSGATQQTSGPSQVDKVQSHTKSSSQSKLVRDPQRHRSPQISPYKTGATSKSKAPVRPQKYYGLSSRDQISTSPRTAPNKNSNIDNALSVIKSIPSIDITPLSTTGAKSKTRNSDDSDIIILD
uniref:Calcineurin-binding protein cabin-1 MEF2-binding domain-containing protein n=1 Tax=Dendroctonus ponderosae TaxID=77166 RepID=A0AAR5P9I3_DENPD